PAVSPRAVAALPLAADRTLWSASPARFRSSSLALHVVCSLLLFALGLRLTRSRAAAGAGALVFAAHPVAVETIDLAAGRGEILGAGFALLALLFLLRARDVDVGERPSALALGLAIACQSAASFASPLAILLSVALIVSLALEPAAERRGARRALGAAILVGASVPARALALAA